MTSILLVAAVTTGDTDAVVLNHTAVARSHGAGVGDTVPARTLTKSRSRP